MTFGAVALAGWYEHRVMFALDFVEGIAERLAEILVGGDDCAIHLEFDHGLRPAKGLDLGLGVSVRLATKHVLLSKMKCSQRDIHDNTDERFRTASAVSRNAQVNEAQPLMSDQSGSAAEATTVSGPLVRMVLLSQINFFAPSPFRRHHF
ncbi:hypothetical protein ABIF66_000389 [Bradyrhizobium japonicum]